MQSVTQHRGEGTTREQRADWLLENAAFERISKEPVEVWIVETPYGSVNEIEWDRRTCSCKDHEVHGHRLRCKHVRSVRKKRDKLKKDARQLAGFFGGEAA